MSQNQNDSFCNLLPSTNSSFLIAQHWENIPETLVLNGCIGFVLYIVFLMMTRFAWNQTYSDESYLNQGLLAFLYGYRDPERWFVIPRYEFLRHTGSHHEHDHNINGIYVPPKLPLANPIEMLAPDFRDNQSSSSEEPPTRIPSPPKIPQATKKLERMPSRFKELVGPKSPVNSPLKQTPSPASPAPKELIRLSSPASKLLSKSTSPLPELLKQPAKSTKSSKSTMSGAKMIGSRVSPLSDSFFYPSILTAEQLQASCLSRILNRIFSSFFKVTDADIIYAKGIDAYEYLLFQRHLILLMFVTNLLCIGVILPIHWLGENTNVSSFQRSTIKNLSPNSLLYWAHIVCAIIIVLAAMIILSSYRDSTLTKDELQLARRTVLIGNIPLMQRSRSRLNEVIRSNFTDTTVEAIQFVYDTKRLEQFQMQLSSIMIAKDYCIYYKNRYKEELMVKPSDVNEQQHCNGNCRFCSFIYVCSCRWPYESKRPGIEYYTEQERRYRNEIETLFTNLVKNPSEYAFVTFKSNKQTKKVMIELARMKKEALGRLNDPLSPQHSRPRSRQTSSLRSESPDSNGSKLISATLKSSKSSKSFKSAKSTQKTDLDSRFLKHDGAKTGDPLDIHNNPHVRSIRSPLKITRASNKSKSLMASESRSSDEDDPVTWSIRYAPHPDNVEYSDLLNLATTERYTVVLLHALMVVIFIFITTPNVILSVLDRLAVFTPAKAELSSFETLALNYISVLLQIITTALLPSLVTLISKQIPYEDTASKSHSMMWKVYLFLVLMVIVMPSVGMSSAQALFSSEIKPRCLFPTDNGAYFVNYVITAIFLSTIMELIKPTDIVSYCFIFWTGRSIADFEGARQFIEREFSVSMQHTNVLLVFAVVMTYAMSCPIIAPAGLVYLIVKHAVDHYHLFYVYFTKKVDKNLQTTIVVFVKVALLLMLFQTTVAISINTGTGYFSFTSQIIFWITLAMFTCNFFLYCTAQTTTDQGRSRFYRDFCACFYLPRAIEDLLRLDALPSSCISRTKQ